MKRWLSKHSKPALQRNETTITVSKTRLPNELLRVIFECVDSTKDLVLLCFVSRLCKLEAERILYTSINIGIYAYHDVPLVDTRDSLIQKIDSKRQVMLFKAIKSPRLSEIVTSIRVHLTSIHQLRKKKWLLPRATIFICDCDELDSKLGEALRDLKNLAYLRIDCFLCPKLDGTHRHTFFKELQTNSLVVLLVECHCSRLERIVCLHLPPFRTVRALKWYSHNGTLSSVFVENPTILPELTTLRTDDVEFLGIMLSSRPINNIRTTYWDRKLHDTAISSTHRGSLQRLSVAVGLTTVFSSLVSQNIQPYINLHQLGRLDSVIEYATIMFRLLETLSVLPKLSTLTMLDVQNPEIQREYCWNQEFLHELKTRLPTLSKVRLQLITEIKDGQYYKRTSEFISWEFDCVWRSKSLSTVGEFDHV